MGIIYFAGCSLEPSAMGPKADPGFDRFLKRLEEIYLKSKLGKNGGGGLD